MGHIPEAILKDFNKHRSVPDARVPCFAPFNSIYFLPEGEVVPCCYNRGHIYGKYPEQSIDEIWNGESASMFRKKMLDKFLLKGCHVCESQLKAKNYLGTHAAIFDRPLRSGQAALTEENARNWTYYPEILEFELHNICNLECVMCHGNHSHLIRRNREGRAPIQSPYDQEFVRQLHPYIKNASVARFLGGEPFLIPVYYWIWDAFAELNPGAEIHITTNGTVLNNRVKQLLEALTPDVILSIDSLTKERFEKIRINGNFDMVRSNIDYFQQYASNRDRMMTLAVCPMVQNWEELPELLHYANLNGNQLYFNTVVDPFDSSLRSLPAEQIGSIAKYLQKEMEVVLKNPTIEMTGVTTRNREAFHDMIKQLQAWEEEKKAGIHMFPGPYGQVPLIFDPEMDFRAEFLAQLDSSTEGRGDLRDLLLQTASGIDEGMDGGFDPAWNNRGYFLLVAALRELDIGGGFGMQSELVRMNSLEQIKFFHHFKRLFYSVIVVRKNHLFDAKNEYRSVVTNQIMNSVAFKPSSEDHLRSILDRLEKVFDDICSDILQTSDDPSLGNFLYYLIDHFRADYLLYLSDSASVHIVYEALIDLVQFCNVSEYSFPFPVMEF